MSSNLQPLLGAKDPTAPKQHTLSNIDADLEKPRKTDHSPHPVEEQAHLLSAPLMSLCKGLATVSCCRSQLMNSGWHLLTFVPQEQGFSRPSFLLEKKEAANQIHICFYVPLAPLNQSILQSHRKWKTCLGKVGKSRDSTSKESCHSSYSSHLTNFCKLGSNKIIMAEHASFSPWNWPHLENWWWRGGTKHWSPVTKSTTAFVRMLEGFIKMYRTARRMFACICYCTL